MEVKGDAAGVPDVAVLVEDDVDAGFAPGEDAGVVGRVGDGEVVVIAGCAYVGRPDCEEEPKFEGVWCRCEVELDLKRRALVSKRLMATSVLVGRAVTYTYSSSIVLHDHMMPSLSRSMGLTLAMMSAEIDYSSHESESLWARNQCTNVALDIFTCGIEPTSQRIKSVLYLLFGERISRNGERRFLWSSGGRGGCFSMEE